MSVMSELHQTMHERGSGRHSYGCSSVVNAVMLQYELAGHGLYTDIRRSSGGMYVCNHAIKRVAKPSFMERWLEQAPKQLSSNSWDVIP
jgi:hypothetical protein